MRKKLLFLSVFLMLFITSTIQAQIKVWNFAGDNLAGYDNLLDTNAKVESVLYSGTGGVIGNSGNADSGNTIGSFGNAATDKVFYVNDSGSERLRMNTEGFTVYNIETKSIFDSFFGAGVPWGRFYTGGSGSDSKRYFGFNLTSGDVITMYYYIDTNDVLHDVTIVTPSGSSTVQADNTSSKEGHMLQVTATEDGLYKVYCGTGKLCVGRIYEGDVKLEDGNLLSFKEVNSKVTVDITATGGRIYISNVNSNTDINVYGITGGLVKSLNTSVDTDFSVEPGVYITTVKTVEGQKSVKLLVK